MAHPEILKKILEGFTELCYSATDNNVELSTEMLFTNSGSLSCCLNSSFELLTQVIVETLTLLLESVYLINRKLQKELHAEYKPFNDKFNIVIGNLKKYDKTNFDYARYDPSEKKAMLNQTIRSNISKTIQSQSIKNYSQKI